MIKQRFFTALLMGEIIATGAYAQAEKGDFNSPRNANHLQNDLKTSAKTKNVKNEYKPLNSSGNTEKTRLARVRRDKKREDEIKRKDDVVVQKNNDDGDDISAESCNDVPTESCRDDVSAKTKLRPVRNATLRRPECHTSAPQMPHRGMFQVWHFTP